MCKKTLAEMAGRLSPGLFSTVCVLLFTAVQPVPGIRAQLQKRDHTHNATDLGYNNLRRNLDRKLLKEAEHGDLAAVRTLLARGASVNAAQENGWTALMLAAGNSHAPVVRLLLGHGADPHRRSALYNDVDALMLAAQAGDSASCRLLLDHGANINETDVDGETPLMQAVSNGNLSPQQVYRIARFLIENGADVHTRDKLGNTVSSLAQGRPSVLGSLTATLHLLEAHR